MSRAQIVLHLEFYLKPLLSSIFFMFFFVIYVSIFPIYATINFPFIFEANISLFCVILLLIFNILSKITKAHGGFDLVSP